VEAVGNLVQPFKVHLTYVAIQVHFKLFKIDNLVMVEAVGVEPTSEKTSNRELSCFSTFIFVSPVPLRTGEDASPTSLIDLIPSAQAEQSGPAYCATIGTSP
jgi:hypothetical protein